MKFLGFGLAGFLIITGALYFFLTPRPPTKQHFKPNTPLGGDPVLPGQKSGPLGQPDETRYWAVRGGEPHSPEAIQPLSPARKAFSKLTQEAFKTLPRQTDPGALDPEQLSQPPPEFIARLEPLIKIGKSIKGNPELVDDGIYFYRQCALYYGFHAAVRARCLSHFVKLSKEHRKPVNMNEFDARLRVLSRAFPD